MHQDNDRDLIWEAYFDKHGNLRGGKDPNKTPEEGGATHSALDATPRPSLTSSDPNERKRAAEYQTRHISPEPERDRARKKLGEDINESQENYDDLIHSVIEEDSPLTYKNIKLEFLAACDAITSDVTYEMKRQGIEVPDDLNEKVCSHLCNMLAQEVSTERKDDGIDDDFRDMMPKSDEPEPFGYGR